MEHDAIKIPSKRRYFLGVLFAVAGVAGFVFLLISTISPDFRIIMPGSHQVQLEEGSYTIFYEYKSQIDGRVFATGLNLPGMRFLVLSPDGTGLELRNPSLNKSYEISGKAGFSIFNFTADRTGQYTIGAGYAEGTNGSDVVIAVGKSSTGSLILAIVSMLAGMVIAGVLLVSTFMMRRRGRPRYG